MRAGQGARELTLKVWDEETRPCRSGNCAPTSLTLPGGRMDPDPPGPFLPGVATHLRRGRRHTGHLVPTFCRHNRLIHNCPICSREQEIELRPIVSPGAAGSG